jgi:4-amino-4-deoxy-L-arabinose transferase-like glycosyltransferase
MIKKYKLHLLILLGLIIINLAFFAINLNDFFLSDDFDWIYSTKTSRHSLLDYFSANYFGEQGVGGSYRPMFNLVFSLAYNLFGLNPLGYHLINLIFHIGVCFLIYLLVLSLFKGYKQKNQPSADKIAILAALFFAILPNHSEAVIWIAAIGDPLSAFFYLLAFYLYILFRKKEKLYYLIISILSFIIALLTKELAITLPLLILVWELYEGISQNKIFLREIINRIIGYFAVLLFYLLARYWAIGLFFGYYAEETFRINLAEIFKMLVALLTNLFFYGDLRILLTDYFMANKLFFILLLILIVSLILLILRKYKFKAVFLLDFYIILILPVLPLAYSHFSNEGERYNYLPSVVFCILLSLLIWQIKKDKFLRNIMIIGLIVYFSVSLINKNYNWHLAGQLTEKIIKQDFPQTVNLNEQDKTLLFISLPDNLEGAQVFRNAIDLAIRLYYPEYKFEGKTLQAYLRLTRQNMGQKILYWRPYPTGGWLAQTFDQGNWVTGLPTKYEDNYVFELWGYNYDNYTSSQIRFYLQNKYLQLFEQDKLDILIFNNGQLKKINK